MFRFSISASVDSVWNTTSRVPSSPHLANWAYIDCQGPVSYTHLLGALIGLINGVVIAYLGVPDFIASLGVGYVVAGINQAYTKGHPISNLPADFEIFGAQRLGGVIPNAVIIMLIVLVVSSIILNQTKLGRYIYLSLIHI